MKKYWQPILTLLVLSPLLTEVLSGNTPPSLFFQPAVFVFLTTLGYGLPVLIIREIFIRKQMGFVGLFILGFAYGLYNEGLLARTVFESFHSPIDIFASYGLWDGIRIPWLVTICVWHSFYAVVFPITITHYLYGQQAKTPWLGLRISWVFGILTTLLATILFLGDGFMSPKGRIDQVLFLFLIGIIAVLTALRFRGFGQSSYHPARRYLWIYPMMGSLVYLLLFFFPLLLAKFQAPVGMFFAYFIVVMFLVLRRILHLQSIENEVLVLFGIGGMISLSFFLLLFALPFGLSELVISAILFIAIFIEVLFCMRKNIASRNTTRDIVPIHQ